MSTPITLTGAYTCGELSCEECNARTAAITAERDRLRAEVERLRSDRDCEKRLRKDAEELRENAIARAARAEADAAAYLKRAESFRKIGDEAETELAAERARLDWVFENYVVEAKDFRRRNRCVYYLDNREDLIVEMKEDAK